MTAKNVTLGFFRFLYDMATLFGLGLALIVIVMVTKSREFLIIVFQQIVRFLDWSFSIMSNMIPQSLSGQEKIDCIESLITANIAERNREIIRTGDLSTPLWSIRTHNRKSGNDDG